MAANMDKALNQAPQGLGAALAQIQPEQPDLEIEIENPESVKINGMEIVPEEPLDEFNINLADEIGERELQTLASELIGQYDDDVSSRKDWMQTYVDGLELLGMKIEDRTEPWPGACGVYHPLLSEALVKFQSETIMETFPAAGPVKTEIIGKETPEKKEAAVRVQNDMNYQLTEVMTEYRPEHERMLWGLGLAGNAFKKVYYDPNMQRQASIFVPAEDIVVPYGASNLQTAERVTHVMRKTKNELLKLQAAGFYRDVDLPPPTNTLDDVEKKIAEKMGFRATSDNRYRLLEMQVDLDLEGYEDVDEDGEATGIALPYIVTIDKGTSLVLAIRRNWEPDDKSKAKRTHMVHYGYIPGFGFYHFGLIHLIGAFAKSGTSLLRQLVDAGTLSNLPGGFKTRGMRVKGDDTPIAPGEFRDVDIPSGALRDNLMPLPYKEPSQVLVGLMNQIVDEGRRFASAADLQVADMSAQSPVGTTLAILERTLKVMSAVQARIHYSMKLELKLLKGIIRDYTPEEYSYEPEEGTPKIKKSDYDQVDVIPVSDPNAATMSQKVVQYQAALQLAQTAPQLYNLPVLHRQMLEVLGIKNANKLVPIAGVAALISFVDLVFCVVIAGSVARMAAFFLPWTSAGDFNYSTGFMVALEYVVYLVFLIAMVIAARGWVKYSSQAHRAQQSQLEVERGRADVAERDRELVRAELAVLRAQIEPHFLWNTLAQVQYLTRKNPQDAEKMTGHLISYLRAAVPQTPGNMTTLGSEVESVRAYLELMKIRMGARLTATVELEPNLSDVSFPPRLIQTLVENAIRHGIEPKVGAVFVTVTVSADTSDGARIVVQVVDNGVGLQAEPATRGTGLGLRSVRDRLNLIYGSEAALAVSGAPHGGTISRIEVPLAKEMN